jgi:CRISPR-associated protein Csx3
LVLVDFGGMPKRKDIILLHRCTHYIIISSQPEDIPEWHNFCRKRGGLKPLAVIHSVLDERLDVLQEKPYLEIIAGPWERGKTFTVPDILLEKVLALSKT